VDQPRGPATLLAMADPDTALSSFRECYWPTFLVSSRRAYRALLNMSDAEVPQSTRGRAAAKESHGVTVVPRRHRLPHLPRRHWRQPTTTTIASGARWGPTCWRSSSARTIASRASWTSKLDKEVKAGHKGEDAIDEGQPPPHPPDKTYSKPEFHWDSVPDTLRGDVDDLLEEYKALRAGKFRKVDVTPHRIEVTPGAHPLRAQP